MEAVSYLLSFLVALDILVQSELSRGSRVEGAARKQRLHQRVRLAAEPPELSLSFLTSRGRYKASMPLPEGRDLVAGSQSSEIVQVCIRVGDGLKPWPRRLMA